MAKKEFTYRGHTTEQLRKMSIAEFALLLPSRERRSILRGMSDEEKSLLRKLGKRDSAKSKNREMIIVPQMIGKTVQVHYGKEYSPLMITEEMVGFRLGELIQTRKPVKHTSPGIGSTKSSASVSVK